MVLEIKNTIEFKNSIEELEVKIEQISVRQKNWENWIKNLFETSDKWLDRYGRKRIGIMGRS